MDPASATAAVGTASSLVALFTGITVPGLLGLAVCVMGYIIGKLHKQIDCMQAEHRKELGEARDKIVEEIRGSRTEAMKIYSENREDNLAVMKLTERVTTVLDQLITKNS